MENNEQNVNAQTSATNEVATVQNNDAPQVNQLPTFESIAAAAPVVSASQIEERIKKAAAGSPASQARRNANSPLGAIRDEGRRRRNERNAEGAQNGADSQNGRGADDGAPRGKRDRREREERAEKKAIVAPRRPKTSVVLPNRREKLSSDLEDELSAVLGEGSVEKMMDAAPASVLGEQLEDGTKVTGRVESIQGESVFVNVGARELGLIPLKQFPDDYVLQVGQEFECVVSKFNSEDGVYEVSLPFAAAEAGDWLSLSKGAIVEARITGVNTGGLECEVGKLRAFMPMSQLATFHVDNPEAFIGEKWKCEITEINPERRNLVVSRRRLMEREREELREKTLSELAEGQTREGLIRKIIDVGVFVDLGGVDGFIPISALSWGRVKHPSDVVKEGERVTVTITKIDVARNKISLSLKENFANPWDTIDQNFHVGDVIRGRVTSIQSFGAYVELTPGLEGLVHISEIAYARVNAVSDVLNVDEYVEAKIINIDVEKRRIGLSMKKLQEDPREVAKREAQAKADAEAAAAEEAAKTREEAETKARNERIKKLQPKKPLKGGLVREGDGDKFGLRW